MESEGSGIFLAAVSFLLPQNFSQAGLFKRARSNHQLVILLFPFYNNTIPSSRLNAVIGSFPGESRAHDAFRFEARSWGGGG